MTTNTDTTAASGAASWDGKLPDSLQRSLNALRLECPPAVVNTLEHEVRSHYGALYTSLDTVKRMYGVARDRLEEIDAALPDPFAAPAAQEAEPTTIDMVLHCPACGLQHIDAPDERTPGWKNEPHRSHLCHGCDHIWRPADVPTNGVAAVQTKGKADSPIAARAPRPQADARAVPRITDPAIAEWVERHDLDRVLRGSHARAAVEDAQTLHLVPGAATEPVEVMEMPTDDDVNEAIEWEFSESHEWPEGDGATVRAFLKHWPGMKAAKIAGEKAS